jgi:hypothetical protein
VLAILSDLLKAHDIIVFTRVLLLFNFTRHYVNDAISVVVNVEFGSSFFLL